MKINYQKADFLRSYGTPEQLPPSFLPEIAFSGRSNVGKSSLINKVLGRKSLAKVSGTPGKTGTINFYIVDQVHFCDLPGYGYARVSHTEKRRWASLMECYFASGRSISLVIQLLDIRHTPTADDMQIIQFMIESGIPFVVVLTKSDKLGKKVKESRLAYFHNIMEELQTGVDIISFSTQNGEGVEALKESIEKVIS